MQAPINTEALQEKWAPLLNAEGQDKITDPHRKMVTACLLYTSPSPRDGLLSRMPSSA